MDIRTNTKLVKRTVEVEKEVAVFTKEEIENMIRTKMKNRGYDNPGEVCFKIKWTYGQGAEIVVTELLGAEVEVEEE